MNEGLSLWSLPAAETVLDMKEEHPSHQTWSLQDQLITFQLLKSKAGKVHALLLKRAQPRYTIPPNPSQTRKNHSDTMNVLITGCSRGIGLGLTKQFLERTNACVVATARNPDESSELQELKRNFDENRLIVAPLDVQKPDQFVALKDFLSQRGMNSIDILIGNAGISNTTHPHNPFLECTPDDMREVYETNVIGNMLLLQTFHEFLIRGDSKIAAIMSSSLGSYTNAAEKSEGTTVAYRCSKAALNMLSILYASEPSAHEAGVKLIILHPGWVKTEMGQTGGQKAKIDIEESTDGMLDILERAVQFQASQSAVGKTGGDEKATKTANKYRFRSPPDELENMEHLNEFVSHLDNNNFAFVRHDGFILQW